MHIYIDNCPNGYNYKYSMVRFFFKINHLDGGVIYLHGSTFRVKDLSHT